MNKNIPNIISLLRIVLSPLLFVFFFLDLRIVAAVFFLVLALTDSLDGYLARKYKLVSSVGKFLDPIADKILVVAAMFIVAVARATEIEFYSYAICFTLLVARDFVVSGFRLIAVEKGIVIAADIWGKIKTFTLDATLTVLFLAYLHEGVLYAGIALLYLSTILSIVGAVNYVVKNKQVLK